MRKFVLLGGGLLGLLIVALTITLNTSLAGAITALTSVPTVAAPAASGEPVGGPGQPDPSAQAPGPSGSGTPTGRAVGVPGIQPRITNPALGQAAFTAQDVIDFVLTQGVHGARIVSTGPVVVEKVEFLSGGAANARLHAEIGQANETLLCVVTVRGNFTLLGPMPGGDRAFTDAVLVFDARTGNLLQQGEAPPTP